MAISNRYRDAPVVKTPRSKILLALLSSIVLGILAVPQCLYLSGLKNVPEDRRPLLNPKLSASNKQTYWQFLGGDNPAVITPRTPHRYIMDFFWPASDFESRRMWRADYRLLGEAARQLMFRQEFAGDWHLSNVSAAIWISKNWTADDALSSVLLESYFGHGFYGIEAAASGYLDTELSELTDGQVLYLLAIKAAPSGLDPWCNPSAHRMRYVTFAEKIDISTAYDHIRRVPPPEGRCQSRE